MIDGFMGPIAAATIVARRHIPLARVLAQSFASWHPDIPFFVLISDGRSLDQCSSDVFTALCLEDMEMVDRRSMSFAYECQPLTYALTPFLLQHLLEDGFQSVVFLKQESLVTNRLTSVLRALESASVVVTPHLVSPLDLDSDGAAREVNILLSGSYNAGCVGVSNSPQAHSFIDWWKDRTTDECIHDVAHGNHFEQRWLDLAPGYFDELKILRDPTVNVGHWNMTERAIELVGETLTVDGQPCELIRFSGFDPEQPRRASVYSDRIDLEAAGFLAHLFSDYANKCLDAGWREALNIDYAHSEFQNGVPIPSIVREIFRALEDPMSRFGDPFSTSGTDNYFDWLRSPCEISGEGLTNLMAGVYERRSDLQLAFPCIQGIHSGQFESWFHATGRYEHQIPTELIA
jgi:hypothetical protein